ncbi:hypothetical protein KFV02_06640 [Desulfohalobiaceae bacterium Ax17]|jgi:hypothetical protein|uniref:hypothetical protein n=1 Tax=Desulfovulcanus ferrireducens TaxID=2831190 RepID=UPI00207BA53C|nr:hypothetical protein [Desulfovulcanus ferrireducens]MBT8763606.1 hypothetical protein [Desulfovulcanus ferrireducens]
MATKFRGCPICGKIVDTENEPHTLYDCRNFILKRLYSKDYQFKRIELEKLLDKVNKKLKTSSRNLVDT